MDQELRIDGKIRAEADFFQHMVNQLFFDGKFRQQARARTAEHHFLDDGNGVGRQRGFGADPPGGQLLLKQDSVRAVGRGQQQRKSFQFFRLDAAAAGQLVGGGDGQQYGFSVFMQHADGGAFYRGIQYDSQIELAVTEHLAVISVIGHLKKNLSVRAEDGEFFHDISKQVTGDGFGCADGETPGFLVKGRDFTGEGEHFLGIGDQGFAFRREADALADAFEKMDAKLGFQLFDVRGDAGLGAV